jgi:hypothetical protein
MPWRAANAAALSSVRLETATTSPSASRIASTNAEAIRPVLTMPHLVTAAAYVGA